MSGGRRRTGEASNPPVDRIPSEQPPAGSDRGWTPWISAKEPSGEPRARGSIPSKQFLFRRELLEEVSPIFVVIRVRVFAESGKSGWIVPVREFIVRTQFHRFFSLCFVADPP